MTFMNRRVAAWGLCIALAVLLVLIVTGALPHLAPAGLARRVSYNSEAYLFALVLAVWILGALPRLDVRTRMAWAVGAGVVWMTIGLLLLASDLPSRIRTLNEPALALGLLIPYVSLRRPLPRWVALLVVPVLGLVVWAVGWAPDSWVIDQAESLGLVVLAVLTFDLVDRHLLRPGAPTAPRVRWMWLGFLVLEPVAVSALGTEVRAGSGAAALTLEFLGRIHESFFGMLLLAIVLLLAPPRSARPVAPLERVTEGVA